MDWIRRNWPDLLIGVALLAVIAGIIATLLSGGSFLRFGQSANAARPAPAQSASQTTSPDAADPAGDAGTAGTPDTTGTDADGGGGVTPLAPGEDATDTGDTADAADAGTSLTDPDAVGGEDGASEDGSVSSDVTLVAPGADGAADANQTAGTQTTGDQTTAGQTGTDSATNSSSAAQNGGAFRIGVGSFGVAENAERRAAELRAAGYPVFTAQQGAFTVVLVGPYASESEAEAVQAELASSGVVAEDTILFELESDDADDASGVDAANDGDNDGADEDTTTGDAVGATTASSPTSGDTTDSEGRYLQVGAYNSEELAAPQIERLEDLGLSPSLRPSEGGGLLRLWVGPFAEDRLASVQTQLSELGIEHFVPAQ